MTAVAATMTAMKSTMTTNSVATGTTSITPSTAVDAKTSAALRGAHLRIASFTLLGTDLQALSRRLRHSFLSSPQLPHLLHRNSQTHIPCFVQTCLSAP
jgi:hypothetical protein